MIHARIGYFPQPERWGCPCTLQSCAGLWEPNAAWPTRLAMGSETGSSVVWKQQRVTLLLDISLLSYVTLERFSPWFTRIKPSFNDP